MFVLNLVPHSESPSWVASNIKRQVFHLQNLMCLGSILVPRFPSPGLKVIKLEYSLKLKIKRNAWLLADRKQPIIALYYEFGNEVKFITLGPDCV